MKIKKIGFIKPLDFGKKISVWGEGILLGFMVIHQKQNWP